MILLFEIYQNIQKSILYCIFLINYSNNHFEASLSSSLPISVRLLLPSSLRVYICIDKYLLTLEMLMMHLGKTLGFSISNHPVQKIQWVLIVDRVAGYSEPVDDCRHHCERESGRNRKIEVCRVR